MILSTKCTFRFYLIPFFTKKQQQQHQQHNHMHLFSYSLKILRYNYDGRFGSHKHPQTYDVVAKLPHTQTRAYAFTPFNGLHMFRVIFKIHYVIPTEQNKNQPNAQMKCYVHEIIQRTIVRSTNCKQNCFLTMSYISMLRSCHQFCSFCSTGEEKKNKQETPCSV